MISDSGSLALYATALDVPLLLTADSPNTVAGSPMAMLAGRAEHLDADRPLRGQLCAAMHAHVPGAHEPVLKQAVQQAGRSAPLLRGVLYRLLELPEPPGQATFDPVAASTPEPAPVAAYVIGGTADENGIAPQRFPAVGTAPVHEQLDNRHIGADVARATLVQLDAAAIMYAPSRTSAAHTLHRWPHAEIAATAVDDRCCALYFRDGAVLTLAMPKPAADPLLLASVAYLRLTVAGELPATETLCIGAARITVTISVKREGVPVRQDSGPSAGD
ncbi:MAG: hypothetical protein GEU98_05230 [Pseudonocardiaceae bacterium]|nr:hypothetical protein [Pseudonocardiaceae bacterium]